MQPVELPPAIYRLSSDEATDEMRLTVPANWISRRPLRSLAFENLKEATEDFLTRLGKSMEARCSCSNFKEGQHLAPFLVLFSGGVDSTLLAAMLHKTVDSSLEIDLCNVSFNQGHAPDRRNSIEAFKELERWAPERTWRLICVDADLDALSSFKDRLIRLLSPRCAVMDLNIGSAIWLAAKAEGYLHPTGTSYTSCARIAFVGHGADEQCVGYARHRTKFREGGWSCLEDELQLEMERLWYRNLGRDDRLIGDHGREARFPFLDEDLVAFLAQLPLCFLFNPSQPRGVGDKTILRAALRQLGLQALATKEKRAIQFGSQIGKMTNKQMFGSNRAANKHHAGSLNLSSRQNKTSMS